MAARFAAGGRLLAFGNGGSATDAQQLATLFLHPGGTARPLPALSLASDASVLTALSNDIGVDVVFARQIAAFGGKADIAVGLSTSGNSDNLLRAFDEASRRGLLTIGIAGYAGGKMAELDSIDYLFVAPSTSVHRIQEAQTTMYNVLWELCQAALGAAGRTGAGRAGGGAMSGKLLIAGVGNIFLGDDGFGVEVASRLASADLPDWAHVVDYGIRGMHLAYDLAGGYRRAILVDATPRGGAPGTIYVIEPDLPAPRAA